MKKVLTALIAAFAMMVSFSGCIMEDDRDDYYYTYSWYEATVEKEVAEVLYVDAFYNTTKYSGRLGTTDLWYYINNGNNDFDARLNILEENLNDFKPYEKYEENLRHWDDVQEDLSKFFEINATDCSRLKDKCHDSKSLQVVAFKEKDTDHYYVIILQLDEKSN